MERSILGMLGYTPSISKKMTHSTGSTEFYASLFCVLSEENKVEINVFPFIVTDHLVGTNQKG